MLEEKIYKNYFEALKSKNKAKSNFLSFLRSELKNQAINLKQERLEDKEVLMILKKQQKQIKEAKESISSSGRTDLIKNLDYELSILTEYLPQPLSEAEVKISIDNAISELNATSIKDMGKVMKVVIEKIGSRADSKRISEIVKEKLSSKN